jgi:hypothetical protein
MQYTFNLFNRTFTNGAGRPDRRFVEKYGEMSFEEAYPLYLKEIEKINENSKKINEFEKHLISLGINCTQSNISESRYYNYNGMKYRFSSHIYPTGSMTNENCIDFASNPELINNISF